MVKVADITLQDTGKVRATDASATFPLVNSGSAITLYGTDITYFISQAIADNPKISSFGSDEIHTVSSQNPDFEIKGVISATEYTTLLRDLCRMAITPTVKKLSDDQFTAADAKIFFIGKYGVGASLSFTDASASFETNELAGMELVDSANASFTISSNTSTVLTLSSGTPTTGAYWIVRTATFNNVKIISLQVSRKSNEKTGGSVGSVLNYTLKCKYTIR